MNYLDLVGSAQTKVKIETMSSLEIANLTGKLHWNVLKDIEKMCRELEIDNSLFRSQYINSRGKQYNLYNLPRRECDILISGYNIKFRAAIIDRWHSLEIEKQTNQKALSVDEKCLELRFELNKLYEREEK